MDEHGSGAAYRDHQVKATTGTARYRGAASFDAEEVSAAPERTEVVPRDSCARLLMCRKAGAFFYYIHHQEGSTMGEHFET